jgi:hypothetical protein
MLVHQSADIIVRARYTFLDAIRSSRLATMTERVSMAIVRLQVRVIVTEINCRSLQRRQYRQEQALINRRSYSLVSMHQKRDTRAVVVIASSMLP